LISTTKTDVRKRGFGILQQSLARRYTFLRQAKHWSCSNKKALYPMVTAARLDKRTMFEDMPTASAVFAPSIQLEKQSEDRRMSCKSVNNC